MTTIAQIKLRNDTAANWTAANPLLAAGELGFETNTGKFKIGTGASAWSALPYYSTATSNGGLSPNGTRSSPNLITAVGGISILGTQREVQFLAGSGGPVSITASPPIQAGTTVGQELVLVGCNAVNTVTFDTAPGVNTNGPVVMGSAIAGGGAGSVIYLVWDGTSWNEVSRR